jgi:transcriptional regulator with XRE-family HTH domain
MENTEMKDRIAHVIRAKNLTAAEFALRLGIQPSNISHLLSGRNNPSLDFVKKLKETFPEYNLDWIIFGRGPVTVSEPFVESAPIGQIPAMEEQEKSDEHLSEGSLFSQPVDVDMPAKQLVSSTESVLKQIILVYSDNTFELISPR